MEILMSIVIGIIFAVSVYLLLAGNILRVILGTLILSNGVYLLLITMFELHRGKPIIFNLRIEGFCDPLALALVLTAIVIFFGVTVFLLVHAYFIYKEYKTDDLEDLRVSADE